MKVIKYHNLCLLLVLIGSTFKYGDIIFSPYLVPYVTILLSFIFILVTFKIPRASAGFYFFQFVIVLGFFLNFLIAYQNVSPFFYNVATFIIPFLGFFAVFYLSNNIEYIELIKIIYIMLLFAVFFVVLESIIRLSPFFYNPKALLENFYLAKYESPFLFDSNTVAIYILSYLMVGMYLTNYFKSKYNEKLKILNIIFIICLFFTFSRAAYLAFIVFYILLLWSGFKKTTRSFLYIFALVVFFVVLKDLLILIESDGSGLTKILVYEDMLFTIKNQSFFNMMFGYGIEDGGFIYSYESGAYAHALIPLIVGQIGIFGAILYFLYAIYINFKVNLKVTPFLASFFILGLSYLNTNTESVFIAFSLISALFYMRFNQSVSSFGGSEK